MKIGLDHSQHYDYYTSSEVDNIEKYNSFYKEKAQDNLQKAIQQDNFQPTKKMSLKSAINRKKEAVEKRQADRQPQNPHKSSEYER